MSAEGFAKGSSLLRGRPFYCREWALDKLRRCLDTRSLAGQPPGVLITGGPGAGKTALCTEAVWPTSEAGQAAGLAARCLAYHFCQREDEGSTVLWRFILGLVEQLTASPLLPPAYKELVDSPSVAPALEPLACQKDPDDAFKRFVCPISTLNLSVFKVSPVSSFTGKTKNKFLRVRARLNGALLVLSSTTLTLCVTCRKWKCRFLKMELVDVST